MSETEIVRLRRRERELEAEVVRLRARPATPEGSAPGGSEKRFRAIFESAVDFAIIVTDRSGRVTDWNPGAERILGWSAEEMRGETADRFFTPEDRAVGRVAVEMLCALETGRASDERWHMRKDGTRFFASGELMLLRDEAGGHLGFLKIMSDQSKRRQAEDALHEARALSAPILNSSRDCIVVLDLHGNNLFVSPGGIEGMEVADVEAILGLSWLRVWKGAEHDAACAAVAQARAGGVGRFQGFCPTHKGTPKWWDVVVSPLCGPDGTPERLVSVGRDVTERHLAEEALRLRGEEFYALADNIPAFAWIAQADGHIYWYNRRWYDYTGTTPETQEGWGWESVHDPASLPAVVERWTRSIETGTPFEMTFPLQDRDGVFRPFLTRALPIRDEGGAIVRWVGTNVDISEQQAAEAELKRRVAESVRERDRAWKNSRDLQVVIDTHGVLRAVNEAWTTILGWQPDEIVGRSYLEFIHPDDHPSSGDALATASAEALPIYENRYRHTDGSYRWISWVAAPEEALIYASGRHVTAEKAAAAELAATQEQLRQAQKMEAVGQLTGGLAHDFNNLLTGISGSLELMQTRMAQGRLTDLDRYINAAQGASKRAAALTHRLLAFSRRQTLDPKPVNVNTLVSGMEELIRRTVGPAVDIEVVGAAGLWPALVDPSQLENALLNLCINARDAMPDGGRITIETANKWLDERAAKDHDIPPGQYLSLCVTDTGTGMSAEVAARAFDPFFTTKPIGEGTGLGLSMIYGFARQSGGQVRIYSELDAGTTLCLYLPRHYGKAGEAEVLPDLAQAPRAGQGETVLIVDDEPTVRMLVTEVLEELGYTAVEAADGAAGLKLLQSDMRIDLLVTDVGLPGGMNGRQMADAGRVVRPGLKVLFITGYAENAVLGNGHLEPGMQVLTKPFVMEALASRIRDLIRGS